MMALDTLISPELKRDLKERSQLIVIDPEKDKELYGEKEPFETELKDQGPNLENKIHDDSLQSISNKDY